MANSDFEPPKPKQTPEPSRERPAKPPRAGEESSSEEESGRSLEKKDRGDETARKPVPDETDPRIDAER